MGAYGQAVGNSRDQRSVKGSTTDSENVELTEYDADDIVEPEGRVQPVTINRGEAVVQTVEGHELTSKDLSLLEQGETPVFAARPSYGTVGGGAHWAAPLLLLTDRRLLISKDRLLGKPKADFSAEWSDIVSVKGQLWNGGGPKIQLLVQTKRTGLELIVEPQHAVDVESAIRAGYL